MPPAASSPRNSACRCRPAQPIPLGEVTQRNGKVVTVWAIEADLDPATITPGLFSLQWPPKSGRYQEFPEIDRVAWLSPDQAREWMVVGQQPLLDRLPPP